MSLLSMSDADLLNLCRAMRITPLAERFIELASTSEFMADQISGRELVSELVCALRDSRESHRIQEALKELGLPGGRLSIEDMNLRDRKGLSRPQMMELLSCNYIRARCPLILTGGTGIGKRWISSLLCTAAVMERFRCRFKRVSEILAEFEGLDGLALREECRRYGACDLVVLLKLGEPGLDAAQARMMAELFNEILGKCAVIIASQIDPDDWAERCFGNRIEMHSALDYLHAHAQVFHLTGGSLRPLYAPSAPDLPSGGKPGSEGSSQADIAGAPNGSDDHGSPQIPATSRAQPEGGATS